MSALLAERGQRKRPGSVVQIMGISMDEAHRMKPSDVAYIEHEYPLVDWRWRRDRCLTYLTAAGWTEVQKSGCVGCPFHSAESWRRLAKDAPDEYADAVRADAELRTLGGAEVNSRLFLHRSLLPLSVVNHGEDQGDLFGNECDGVCAL